jgi:hypothetical protein
VTVEAISGVADGWILIDNFESRDAANVEGAFMDVNNTSIGGILRASSSHWVTGLIDDVAIWKRALSDDEVIGLNDDGSPTQLSKGLVAYWPLDEVQGDKTPDLINGYDLELLNLTADDLVEGQKGNAFSFSNENNTLLSRVHDAADELPANKHESFTISMWSQVDGNGQNDLRVFSEGNTANNTPLFNIGTDNGGVSGAIDLYIRQGGWPTVGYIYSTAEPYDGEWHHVVFVQENRRMVSVVCMWTGSWMIWRSRPSRLRRLMPVTVLMARAVGRTQWALRWCSMSKATRWSGPQKWYQVL